MDTVFENTLGWIYFCFKNSTNCKLVVLLRYSFYDDSRGKISSPLTRVSIIYWTGSSGSIDLKFGFVGPGSWTWDTIIPSSKSFQILYSFHLTFRNFYHLRLCFLLQLTDLRSVGSGRIFMHQLRTRNLVLLIEFTGLLFFYMF